MAEDKRRQLPVIPPELYDDKLPYGRFSNAQYDMYKRCPKQWEFRYVKGLKRPPRGDMVRGLAVHAATEVSHLYILENKALPPLDLPMQAAFERFDTDAKEVEKWDDPPHVVKNVSLSLVKHYHQHALPYVKPITAEEPFVAKVGIVPMIGFIDRVDLEASPPQGGVEDPGQVVVYDTKTSATKWSKRDVDTDSQLTLYAIVKGAYNVGVDNLVPLKGGPAYHRLTSTRDKHAKQVYIEDLEETADLTKRGIFPKTSIDHWMCSEKWCGYWSLCRGKRS